MTLASRIHFEEPPARTTSKKRSRNEKIADTLRRHPGDWARIAAYSKPTSAASVAHQIRHGKLPAFTPEGSFEATVRGVGSTHRLYARYVGEGGEYA